MDIRLAYSDDDNVDRSSPKKWTPLFTAHEKRPMSCVLDPGEDEDFDIPGHGPEYDCDPLHLFQLGSVPHLHYLLNLRIPTTDENLSPLNDNIGIVQDLDFVVSKTTNISSLFWLGRVQP